MGYEKNLAYLYVPVLAFYRDPFMTEKKSKQNIIQNVCLPWKKKKKHLLLPAVKQQPVAKELREKKSIFITSVPLTPFYKMEARNTVSYKHEILAKKYLNSKMHI